MRRLMSPNRPRSCHSLIIARKTEQPPKDLNPLGRKGASCCRLAIYQNMKDLQRQAIEHLSARSCRKMHLLRPRSVPTQPPSAARRQGAFSCVGV